MTAQIGDRSRYQDREYEIVATSEPLLFHPYQYGIEPQRASTACDSGFWCIYNITRDQICLEDLYVNSRGDYYPAIEGVLPTEQEQEDFAYMGHHLYKGIRLPIAYTGKLLLGDDFLDRYYEHMGYQKPWAYEKLLELTFENGKLLAVSDQSQVAARVRQILAEHPDFLRELRYYKKRHPSEPEDKIWWL